jgi:hypothetical protein
VRSPMPSLETGSPMKPNTSTTFPKRYAEICKSLRELFESEGMEPPMLLFVDQDGVDAFHIDAIGHVHRDHRRYGFW